LSGRERENERKREREREVNGEKSKGGEWGVGSGGAREK